MGGHHRQLRAAASAIARAPEPRPRRGRNAATQVEAPGKGQPIRGQLPLRLPLVQQRMADVAQVRAGKRDQAFGALLVEPALADFGAAAVLVGQIGAGNQPAQQQIPGVILGEQQNAERLVPVGLITEPQVAADDGLYAFAASGLVEFHHAEQVAEVGEGESRHAVGHRPGHRVLDAHDPIHNGVLAVEPQVDEGGSGHGGKINFVF